MKLSVPLRENLTMSYFRHRADIGDSNLGRQGSNTLAAAPSQNKGGCASHLCTLCVAVLDASLLLWIAHPQKHSPETTDTTTQNLCPIVTGILTLGEEWEIVFPITCANSSATASTCRSKAFTTRNIESSFQAAGIYPLSPIIILSTLRMPTPTPRVTPPPITTPNDLDRSLLDSSPPEGTELREATLLVNRIVRSSTIETPVKRYIERSGVALEKTTSENAHLRKENAEFRELLRVRRERKKGKRIAIKGKFVFNTEELLEIVENAEAEASKRKGKRSRTTRGITPEIEENEEEGIENDRYEGESDCIIVASSRSKSK